MAKDDHSYVSRGALKLLHALEQFSLSVEGLQCLDCGCSTGGFTDVMLERGAEHVVAVDTAYGELAWKLRQDERVTVLERTNAMHLPEIDPVPDFVTVDVSLTPLEKILGGMPQQIKDHAQFVVLYKPQYQVAKKGALRKGVVLGDDAVFESLTTFAGWLETNDWAVQAVDWSPITGKSGNREIVIHLLSERQGSSSISIAEAIGLLRGSASS